MLAIATIQNLYIYEYNGTKFVNNQTINLNTSHFRRVSWTEDKQYLTFAGENEEMAYVYKFTGESYEEIESNG